MAKKVFIETRVKDDDGKEIVSLIDPQYIAAMTVNHDHEGIQSLGVCLSSGQTIWFYGSYAQTLYSKIYLNIMDHAAWEDALNG